MMVVVGCSTQRSCIAVVLGYGAHARDSRALQPAARWPGLVRQCPDSIGGICSNMAAPTAVAAAAMQHRFRICSFNVLAPSARICSPLDGIPCRERHEAVCAALLESSPSVACLQEFDFSPRTIGFRALFLGATR